MDMLSKNEIDIVNNAEIQLKKVVYDENDETRLTADLIDLYIEITDLLLKSKNVEKLYDYSKLLARQLQYYEAQEAYIFGKKYYEKPLDEIAMIYFVEVDKKMQEEDLESVLQSCFTEILDYLGNAKGLLYDFTETFRTVHGAIFNHSKTFIDMGRRENLKKI